MFTLHGAAELSAGLLVRVPLEKFGAVGTSRDVTGRGSIGMGPKPLFQGKNSDNSWGSYMTSGEKNVGNIFGEHVVLVVFVDLFWGQKNLLMPIGGNDHR